MTGITQPAARRLTAASILLLGLIAPDTGHAQNASEDGSTVVYPAAYFTEWQPITAGDMLARIRGKIPTAAAAEEVVSAGRGFPEAPPRRKRAWQWCRVYRNSDQWQTQRGQKQFNAANAPAHRLFAGAGNTDHPRHFRRSGCQRQRTDHQRGSVRGAFLEQLFLSGVTQLFTGRCNATGRHFRGQRPTGQLDLHDDSAQPAAIPQQPEQ